MAAGVITRLVCKAGIAPPSVVDPGRTVSSYGIGDGTRASTPFAWAEGIEAEKSPAGGSGWRIVGPKATVWLPDDSVAYVIGSFAEPVRKGKAA